jgi:hypothetical protein
MRRFVRVYGGNIAPRDLRQARARGLAIDDVAA